MRVRETAWIEKNPRTGIYNVKTNSGCISYYTNYEDAMSYVNHINNEDSEGHYFDDGRLSEEEEELLRKQRQSEWELQQARNARLEAQAKRSAERREKEQQKVEDNRKSKRSNDKYVYVISLIERGGGNLTEYFKGETNLLKMDSFTAYKETDAKVFETKASAQKVVDTLTKNYLVKKLYRNIKVVQKKREIFK